MTERSSSENTVVGLAYPAIHNTGADRDFRAAQARGFAAGFAAGSREAALRLAEQTAAVHSAAAVTAAAAHTRTDAAITHLARAARALDDRTVPVLAEAERSLLQAAIALAESVLQAELRDDATSARTALSRALGHPQRESVSVVRLHPADLRQLAGQQLEGVTLVADASLSRGDAIAELPVGYLDARIGTALTRARRELLEE